MEMIELVSQVLKEIIGEQDITPETEFVNDLSLNSFDIVNMICAFEERLHIEIPDRDIRNFIRVQDVLDYMNRRGITAELENC
jgi:acyl carrier protein